jgi:hypothetical protein
MSCGVTSCLADPALKPRCDADPIADSPPAAAACDWLHQGILGLVILGCSVLLAQNQPDADLWGHIQYGRDALTHGLPEHSTYTYTAEGYRWINHENLAEILLALGADTIGIVGLQAAKCLLGVLLLGLIAWRARQRGVGLIAICATLFLVAFALAPWWTLRPQLLSFVWTTCLLLVLDHVFTGWEDKWHLPWCRNGACARDEDQLDWKLDYLRHLWWVVPLMALWANSHAGFGIGVCLFVAVLLCRGFEAWVTHGSQSYGLLSRFGLMIGACVAATFLTPYGPNLHKWLLTALSVSRPEITEWNPLDPWSVQAIPYLLIVAAFAASAVASRRTRDFTYLAVMAAVLVQAIQHERHIAIFAILFGFWMPVHVQSLLERLSPSMAGETIGEDDGELVPPEAQPDGLATAPPAVRWGFAIALGIGGLLLAGRLAGRIGDMPVPRSEWPVSAFQYMADHGLKGKIVCTFNWAQYAIAAFGQPDGFPAAASPHGLSFHFDGRCCTCYPQSVIDEHFDWVLGLEVPHGRYRSPDSPPFDEARVLETGSPDLVLACRRQPHSTAVMEQHRRDWVLLYQDATAQLWGRKSRYDDAASPYYLPPSERAIGDAPQLGAVSWPALPELRGGDLQSNRRHLAQLETGP